MWDHPWGQGELGDHLLVQYLLDTWSPPLVLKAGEAA